MQKVSQRMWDQLYDAVLTFDGEPFSRRQIAKRMGRSKSPVLVLALNSYESEGWLFRSYSYEFTIPRIVYRQTDDFPIQLTLEDGLEYRGQEG